MVYRINRHCMQATYRNIGGLKVTKLKLILLHRVFWYM